MKTTIIDFDTAPSSAGCGPEQFPLDDFFSRYAAAEGFTSVQLEQKMMQLMSRQARGSGATRGLPYC